MSQNWDYIFWLCSPDASTPSSAFNVTLQVVHKENAVFSVRFFKYKISNIFTLIYKKIQHLVRIFYVDSKSYYSQFKVPK